jgi:hypothetical protein
MANQLLYGFIQLKDLTARRVTEVGVSVVNTAIEQAVAEALRNIEAVTSLFATPTTEFKTKFNSPSIARLQPLDESGRARPIKPGGQYPIAFPLQDGGAAWGMTYKAREKMTVQDANDATATLIGADARWMGDHVRGALFANVPWVFPDPEHDDLTIEGLANGDAVRYQVQAGNDQGATDNHYLFQADAIDDDHNPFPTIHDELTEHPENSGEVLSFIPSNLKNTVKGLQTFYPEVDPNIQQGSGVSVLSGTLGVPLPDGPGSLLGYDDSKVWIAEWKKLPDNIIVSLMTGGERPLAMREDEVETLRGFRKVAQRDDHPFYESQWLRIAGFGGRNRVGALVMKIGSGSYSVPTGYESPVP